MGWWEAHDGVMRAMGWRIRALIFLVIGGLGAADALFEIAGQVTLKLSTGTWHFQTFADLLHRNGAVGAPSWPADIPTAPLYLVIGCLLVRQGLGLLSGKTRIDDDTSGEQGPP